MDITIRMQHCTTIFAPLPSELCDVDEIQKAVLLIFKKESDTENNYWDKSQHAERGGCASSLLCLRAISIIDVVYENLLFR